MKKDKLIVQVMFIFTIMLLLIGCSTSNEIINKTYNVEINIENINEAFVPAAEKGVASSVGVSAYASSGILTSMNLSSLGSGVVYSGKATLNDGTIIENITETKNRNDVKYYTYRAITNYHVVGVSGREVLIKVYLSKIDALVEASVLGYNAYEDLAIVEFSTTIYIPTISFGNDQELKVGETVLAIGNPEGYDYADSITLGVISSTKRYVEVNRDTNADGKNDWTGDCEFIQHDAAINSGNSGGALVNIKGELVGINAMKLIDNKNPIEGMGFAIPISIVNKYLNDMENGVTIKQKRINGNIFNINQIINNNIFDVPQINIPNGYKYEYGVYVYDIKFNQYGLIKDDIIIKLNDNEIYNVAILNETIRNDINDSIKWFLFRNGEYMEIEYQVKE